MAQASSDHPAAGCVGDRGPDADPGGSRGSGRCLAARPPSPDAPARAPGARPRSGRGLTGGATATARRLGRERPGWRVGAERGRARRAGVPGVRCRGCRRGRGHGGGSGSGRVGARGRPRTSGAGGA